MKIALVHYWLVGMRGGEKVLEELCKLFPNADIYTHVAIPEKLSDTLNAHRITETFIGNLPGARKHYQKYLPLMPHALEALDLSEYDLVISSESGPAKGVITRPDAVHICYVHSPMRYIWDQYHVYRKQSGFITRAIMPILAHKLRIWDVTSARRIDKLVANSKFVAKRTRKFWGRDADVIYPPVNTSEFRPKEYQEPQDFYLYAGELASYKRADLAIKAFKGSKRKLVVIGEGSERAKLEEMAGENITFLGKVPFDELKRHYAQCKALIFPGVEDFGIIPVEVMASGRPVIAYAGGGALETVVDGETGVLFDEPSSKCLTEAMEKLEATYKKFDQKKIIEHAEQFSNCRFQKEIMEMISRSV
ncbi:glycosyltransferase [Alloyangia pacifica]|uniref:glycosyltransferase n=1 Tax=Alloyangia pacifica TaxID=311180 RepID=UPI001CFD3C8D|nr:glycosyltransferase [Alloyangia pacifica]